MSKKLYGKGLEKFPPVWVGGQNLFLIVYFALAFAGMYPVQIRNIPVISLLFIFYMIIVLFFVLRKHLCTSCYYYNRVCHVGWGKLSAYMFKRNSGNYRLGGKLAQFTWIVMATMLPIAVTGVVVIWKWFSPFYTLIFAVLVAMSVLNFLIQKKSCQKCKMRLICPASLAKGT